MTPERTGTTETGDGGAGRQDVPIKTRQGQAVIAAVSWHAQYYRGGQWAGLSRGRESQDVYDRLRALTPPTPEAVNEIIGNTSWTDCRCDHCGRFAEAVAQLGQEPDYESATALVCLDCLRAALVLLEEAMR